MGIAGQTRNDFSNVFSSATANTPASSALAGRNPLEGTHELRQACQLCFVKKGKGLFGLYWILFYLFFNSKAYASNCSVDKLKYRWLLNSVNPDLLFADVVRSCY